MIAFPELLVVPARQAGIQVPENPSDLNANYDSHPYWFVYCIVQIGRPLRSPNSQWSNARLIRGIPEDQIKTITLKELEERGLE